MTINYAGALSNFVGYQLKRQQIVYLHDLCLASLSLPAALYLRLGNQGIAKLWPEMLLGTILFAVVAAVVFKLFGMYRRVWRYASMSDLIVVVKCATVAVLVFLPLVFLANRLVDMPRSVPVIQWLALVAMLGGPRFTYRLLKDQHWDVRTIFGPRSLPVVNKGIPVLLLGASDAAALFIRAMSSDRDAPYRVVGILDENGYYADRSIHGVPVLDTVDRFEETVDQLPPLDRPRKLIIASPTSDRLKGPTLQNLFDQAEKRGMAVARLPSLVEFKEAADDGKVDLRPIALEDLLVRPQTMLDRQAIDQLIGDRRVLVTGAGGTIGGELVRQIAALGPRELILLDNSEFNLYSIDVDICERCPDLASKAVLCDIRDRDHIERIFAEHKPELVFHAAALKHVPMVELNPFEGVRTNVIGTRNVADAAHRHGAIAVVQVSTDKAVNPTNVMGATKRLAEFYCQSLDNAAGDAAGALQGDESEKDGQATTRFMIVRFGNVLGSSGSVVPLFQRQLAKGGPLTVTHPDITRYFMTVREAVELVIQASAYGVAHAEQRSRIFVLDMGDPLKIVDVAHQLIRLAGLRPEIDVGIEFVGLRPGEKLYEELFDESEDRLPAAVDGVELAVSQPIDTETLRQVFDDFAAICETRDGERLQQLLKQVLPSYRPLQEADEKKEESQQDLVTV